MKTLEALLAMIAAGQSVVLNGEHYSSPAALEAAYPAAKEAYDAAQVGTPQALVAATTELKEYRPPEQAVTRADLDALHDRITGAMVLRSEHDELQEEFDALETAHEDLLKRVRTDYLPMNEVAERYVPKADVDALKGKPVGDVVPKVQAEALADRNGKQADLIAVLIKDPADIKKLAVDQLRAVAIFEEAHPEGNREELVAAILAKRGG